MCISKTVSVHGCYVRIVKDIKKLVSNNKSKISKKTAIIFLGVGHSYLVEQIITEFARKYHVDVIDILQPIRYGLEYMADSDFATEEMIYEMYLEIITYYGSVSSYMKHKIEPNIDKESYEFFFFKNVFDYAQIKHIKNIFGESNTFIIAYDLYRVQATTETPLKRLAIETEDKLFALRENMLSLDYQGVEDILKCIKNAILQ